MAQPITVIIQAKDSTGQTIQKVNKNLGGIGDTVKKLATGLGGLMAFKSTLETVFDAAEIDNTRKTFARLVEETGDKMPRALDKLRSATRGMVSDAELMKSANQFLVMGLADSTEEASKFAEMATQLGRAMGKDAVPAMADFASMLANQSIPRLDTFGISSGRVRESIEAQMKANAELTREQAFLNAVLKEGGAAMERVGEQGEGAAAGLARTRASAANLRDEIGSRLLKLLSPLMSGLDSILVPASALAQVFSPGGILLSGLGALPAIMAKVSTAASTMKAAIVATDLLALLGQLSLFALPAAAMIIEAKFILTPPSAPEDIERITRAMEEARKEGDQLSKNAAGNYAARMYGFRDSFLDTAQAIDQMDESMNVVGGGLQSLLPIVETNVDKIRDAYRRNLMYMDDDTAAFLGDAVAGTRQAAAEIASSLGTSWYTPEGQENMAALQGDYEALHTSLVEITWQSAQERMAAEAALVAKQKDLNKEFYQISKSGIAELLKNETTIQDKRTAEAAKYAEKMADIAKEEAEARASAYADLGKIQGKAQEDILKATESTERQISRLTGKNSAERAAELRQDLSYRISDITREAGEETTTIQRNAAAQSASRIAAAKDARSEEEARHKVVMAELEEEAQKVLLTSTIQMLANRQYADGTNALQKIMGENVDTAAAFFDIFEGGQGTITSEQWQKLSQAIALLGTKQAESGVQAGKNVTFAQQWLKQAADEVRKNRELAYNLAATDQNWGDVNESMDDNIDKIAGIEEGASDMAVEMRYTAYSMASDYDLLDSRAITHEGYVRDIIAAYLDLGAAVPAPAPYTPGGPIPGEPQPTPYPIPTPYPYPRPYAYGGMVPGPVGAPQRATVHGGEGIFTPEQLRALPMAGGGVHFHGCTFEGISQGYVEQVFNEWTIGQALRGMRW